jgi:hypothetical protein
MELTPDNRKSENDKLIVYHQKISILNKISVNKNENSERQTNNNNNNNNLFKVFHQNIRGLKSKVDELINSLLPEYPQIVCLTEHHLKDFEIDNLSIDYYKLGSKFCRQEFKNGG